MKHFRVVLCILMSMLIFVMPCSAAGGGEETVSPLVYTPCTGGNGKCVMVSHAWAHIRDANTGNYLYSFVCCWQCRNCQSVMATEGDPLLGQPIGHYVVVSSDWELQGYVAIINVLPSQVKYTSSTRIEGYTFRSG